MMSPRNKRVANKKARNPTLYSGAESSETLDLFLPQDLHTFEEEQGDQRG